MEAVHERCGRVPHVEAQPDRRTQREKSETKLGRCPGGAPVPCSASGALRGHESGPQMRVHQTQSLTYDTQLKRGKLRRRHLTTTTSDVYTTE